MAEPKVYILTTFIKNKWHCRLFKEDNLLDEMACINKKDIGWICREMLRWYDKTWGDSNFAYVGRHKHHGKPTGKIWYKNKLDEEKENKSKRK